MVYQFALKLEEREVGTSLSLCPSVKLDHPSLNSFSNFLKFTVKPFFERGLQRTFALIFQLP